MKEELLLQAVRQIVNILGIDLLLQGLLGNLRTTSAVTILNVNIVGGILIMRCRQVLSMCDLELWLNDHILKPKIFVLINTP